MSLRFGTHLLRRRMMPLSAWKSGRSTGSSAQQRRIICSTSSSAMSSSMAGRNGGFWPFRTFSTISAADVSVVVSVLFLSWLRDQVWKHCDENKIVITWRSMYLDRIVGRKHYFTLRGPANIFHFVQHKTNILSR